MQRNQRNNRRGAKPRRGQLRRVANGVTQNGAGVSHQDAVPQVRKFQIFKSMPFENASSDYAFGLTNFNINGGSSPLKPLLTAYAGFYEQYRIRKIKIRAQVGNGYDNDKRIKTLIAARVDVDNQPTQVTINTVQQVNCSENAVIKTFTERGNVLLATFRPQCRINTTASLPILPNRLQFYPINDHNAHVWKGCTTTCLIPEPSITPNSLGITLIAEVDVEFRGRISDQIIFSQYTINQHVPLVRPSELIGNTFTVPSLSRNYEIIFGDDSLLNFEAKWGNNNIDVVTMANLQIRLGDGTYTNWTGPNITGY